MSRFLNSRYSSLKPYVPGEQPKNISEFIKLNTNESPFEPSPMAIKAINDEATRLNLYPTPTGEPLMSALSKRYGVPTSRIFTSNGSDETLAFAFLAFCGKDKGVCFPDISYGFYKVYAQLCCVDAMEIPLDKDFKVVPEDYFNSGRTVVIANPNAPTSLALTLDEVESIVKNNPNDVVIIDEAYVDFGAQSAVSLIDKYDNLLVIQTFSKSRNMAGERLGFAFGGEGIISDLNAIRYSFNPYNVDRLALVAGAASIEDEVYFKQCTEEIIRVREYTAECLKKMGFEVLPSKTNFLFAKPAAYTAEEVFEYLKTKHIYVRHFKGERVKDYLRISIGTAEEMQELIQTLKDWRK